MSIYDRILNRAWDIAGQSPINDYSVETPLPPTNIETRDCINDLGFAQGAGDAFVDVYYAKEHDTPVDPMLGYIDAFNACDGIVQPVTPSQEISIPNIPTISLNPYIAVLEVALTPTELTPATVTPLYDYEGAFREGYVDGRFEGISQALDKQLDDISNAQIDPIKPADDSSSSGDSWFTHENSFGSIGTLDSTPVWDNSTATSSTTSWDSGNSSGGNHWDSGSSGGSSSGSSSSSNE